ncbi:uncharacterized protein [Physcomitrium patens]|uniref:uncharacterized protein isoform X2 n=1 Tax=Physcomitrium patens TaxID=3218 RepID=UPI000D155E80|nr:protein SCAI-like isoform X2 [Physcomitrium patens]|eukprot:XP_024388949.1 protein SCAI-like isoform X2 [Physcomitrella patens]
MAPRVHSTSEEYRALVDKAYNKFARLREFPAYGRNKWDFYFHKAFQVYSKLWKFQQDNRVKLLEMGLKRWEIGEIASRIGQLYYNYYLRTSDSKFLIESYIFYQAIQSREYFKELDKDAALANKQLRYTARFIVICLLLNRRETVQLLVRQLRSLVDEYARTFSEGTDAKDWKIVVQEIGRFMKADGACETSRSLRYCLLYDPHPSIISSVHKVEGKKPLHLKDSILASYYHHEVKFSELTLDTFRMLQALEWEPSGSLFKARTDSSMGIGASGGIGVSEDISDPSLPPNPHKYILYRPTVQELLLVLATACDELPCDGIALLYISASGRSGRSLSMSMSTQDLGEAPQPSKKGVVSLTPTLSLKNANSYVPHTEVIPDAEIAVVDEFEKTPSTATNTKEIRAKYSPSEPRGVGSPGLWLGSKRSPGFNFLYPIDILPFTRRPLFIIIDSANSFVFESIIGEERGEQAILLLSPSLVGLEDEGATSTYSSSKSSGNMFTFFLTAPLLAFCRVIQSSSKNMSKGNFEQTERLFATLIAEWGNVLDSAMIDPAWARILGDPFLRQLTCRFIFCRAVFGLHSKYRDKPEHMPRCYPPLPDELLPTSKVVEMDEATTTGEDFSTGEASEEEHSDDRYPNDLS